MRVKREENGRREQQEKEIECVEEKQEHSFKEFLRSIIAAFSVDTRRLYHAWNLSNRSKPHYPLRPKDLLRCGNKAAAHPHKERSHLGSILQIKLG